MKGVLVLWLLRFCFDRYDCYYRIDFVEKAIIKTKNHRVQCFGFCQWLLRAFTAITWAQKFFQPIVLIFFCGWYPFIVYVDQIYDSECPTFAKLSPNGSQHNMNGLRCQNLLQGPLDRSPSWLGCERQLLFIKDQKSTTTSGKHAACSNAELGLQVCI